MSRRLLASLLLIGAVASLSACGNDPMEEATPPSRQFIDLQHQEYAERQFYVSDPAQGANKHIYKFNAQLDRYVLLPIVDAYKFVTPEFLRTRVSRFFANVGEITNFTNSVLQGSGSKAATTLGRFAINTTVGLLGTFEVASDWGLERQQEDFGQTLGVWGAGPGPYVVLPFFGPSNLRDSVGIAADLALFSLIIPNDVEDETAYKVAFYGVQPLNMRYINPFRYYESGTPFEYEFVRYLNTQARELAVKN